MMTKRQNKVKSNQSKSFIFLNRFYTYFINWIVMVNTKHLISILVSLAPFGLKAGSLETCMLKKFCFSIDSIPPKIFNLCEYEEKRISCLLDRLMYLQYASHYTFGIRS